MKRSDILRLISGGLAFMMTWLSIPVCPAAAEEQLALRISKLVVSESEIGENRTLSVDVSVEGNENGFLAAEFGIAYDSRLALQSIQPRCKAAESFYFNSTSENHMIWFSGAGISAGNCATQGKTSLFSLDFILPPDYQVGDEYTVTYEWNGVDGSSGFWYIDEQTDAIDSLMAYSRAGSISIPATNAPHLSKSAVELNPGSSYTLTVENSAADGVWFSDNESIASVENGVIHGNSPGSCVISVFLGDASSLLSCDVTVRSEYLYSMFDTDPILIVSKDQSVRLEYPNEIGTTVWISTNPNVVTVDEGRLKPVSNGTAQVIATNNGVSKLKAVTVQLGGASEPTTAAPTTAAPTTQPPSQKCGDINADGQTDILDVIALNKNLLGAVKLTDVQAAAADVYHDGKVNGSDSLYLLKYVLELIQQLPVEP